MNQSTFCHFFIESGLHNLKENGVRDDEQVHLNAYFAEKSKNRSKHTKKASKSTQYLTDHEELEVIQLCHLLGSMGYGITCDELQDIVSNITNWQANECEVVEVSDKIVRGLFSHHGKLLKIV